MLTKEQNDLITRVGPGTPMGNALRRYWTPALLSDELPNADCPPVRVRLLGEDLVAWRDTTGNVGLIAANCPHRGASLFFGRVIRGIFGENSTVAPMYMVMAGGFFMLLAALMVTRVRDVAERLPVDAVIEMLTSRLTRSEPSGYSFFQVM